MTKKIFTTAIVFFVCTSAFTQGINFRNITFTEALEQAATEGKPVFLDCYTEWCGPCKRMDADVFPQKEIGDFFNEKFISIKIDMEKSEGPKIGAKYCVRSYPTFLILEPNGSMRYIMVGGSGATAFFNNVKAAFDDTNALSGANMIAKLDLFNESIIRADTNWKRELNNLNLLAFVSVMICGNAKITVEEIDAIEDAIKSYNLKFERMLLTYTGIARLLKRGNADVRNYQQEVQNLEATEKPLIFSYIFSQMKERLMPEQRKEWHEWGYQLSNVIENPNRRQNLLNIIEHD